MNDHIVEIERAEADRFAEVVTHLEAGQPSGLDPLEDPALAADASAAAALLNAGQASTSTGRYASYRQRARSSVLHRLGVRNTVETDPDPDRHRGGIPLLRWPVLTPIASAAAAAVAVLAVVVAFDQPTPPVADVPAHAGALEPLKSPDPAPTVPAAAEPIAADDDDDMGPAATVVQFQMPGASGIGGAELIDTITGAAASAVETPSTAVETPSTAVETPSTAARELAVAESPPFPTTVSGLLERVDGLLGVVTADIEHRRPVAVETLRDLTESIAAVAYRIETEPDSVSDRQVLAYLHQTAHSRLVLAAADVGDGEDGVLTAARRIAEDGVAVATNYIRFR
jgi:hypothetical protein